MNRSILILGFLVSMLASTFASAIPTTLGLVGGDPDIQSSYVNFIFDADENLSILGTAIDFRMDGDADNIYNGGFSITGKVGAVTTLDFLITGTLVQGNDAETLLSGSLDAMANNTAGGFQFIFNNLSGALSSFFGAQAGVTFLDSDLAGFDFSQAAATTSYSATTNTFAVPAPGSLSLSLIGFAILGFFRLRRSAK